MQKIKSLAVAVLLAFSTSPFILGCGGGGSSSSTNSSSTATSAILSPADGSTLPNATEGQSYTQVFSVSGGGGTPPFTFAAAGAPSGMTFTPGSNSGTLTGVPSQVGTGTFEITVTDANNVQTVADYTLTIDPAGGILAFTPTTASQGTINIQYTFNFFIQGGTLPFNFNIASGTLPPGLTLGPAAGGTNGEATISGQPVAQGTYNVTVTVTDSSSPQKTGSQPYSITIN